MSEEKSVTRKAAHELGQMYYYPSKPCRAGHTSKRRVNGWRCVECQAISDAKNYAKDPKNHNITSKRWRDNNRDKHLSSVKKWQQNNKDRILITATMYRANNIAKLAAASAKWRQDNKDHLISYNKKWRSSNSKKHADTSKRWAKNNPEHVAAYTKQWAKDNPWKRNEIAARRRTAKLQALPDWLTEFDQFALAEIYKLSSLRTKMLGVKHHVDHIIPLQGKNVCGLHVPLNLQIITANENHRKGISNNSELYDYSINKKI